MEFLKDKFSVCKEKFIVWFNTPTYTTNGNATVIIIMNLLVLLYVL